MRVATCVIGVVVLLLGLALPGMAQPADPFLVVPGQGIGEVRLGMTITEVVKVLGNPQESHSTLTSIVLPADKLKGATIYIWPDTPSASVTGGSQWGFRITADATGTVLEIMTPSPDRRYHTSDGLAIDSREQAVLTRLGAPSRTVTLGHEKYDIYDAMGIVFLIDTNPNASNHGLVNDIWVFAPAHT